MRNRGWRRRVAGTCALVLAGAAGSHSTQATLLDGTRYGLGRGLEIPALHLTFSGYSSLRARVLEGPLSSRFDLRDLSVFTRWQPSSRWHLFSEIEFENPFVVDDRGPTADDLEIAVERIYAEYAVNADWSMRAGRYLTPFGRWNLVHADPLVWTVSRPLVTALVIPDHGTGLALLASAELAGRTLATTLFVDDSDDLDPVNGDADFEDVDAPGVLVNDFEHGGGLQLRYNLLEDRAEIGVSYATFAFSGIEGQLHAIGVDGILRWRRFELSFETAYRDNSGRFSGDDWGGFVQAVVPLLADFYGIARGEVYRSGILDQDVTRHSWGLVYRPLPPVSVKFEYHDGNQRSLAPDGFEWSLSVLF